MLDIYRLFESGNNDAVINLLVAQLALQLFHIGVSEWVDIFDIDLLSLYNHSIAVSNSESTTKKKVEVVDSDVVDPDDMKQEEVTEVLENTENIEISQNAENLENVEISGNVPLTEVTEISEVEKPQNVESAQVTDHDVDDGVNVEVVEQKEQEIETENVENNGTDNGTANEIETESDEMKEPVPSPPASPQPLSQSLSADAEDNATVSAPELLKENSVDIDSLTQSMSTEERTEVLNQKKAASKGTARRKQSVTLLKLENDILNDPQAMTPEAQSPEKSASPSIITMIGGGGMVQNNAATLSLRQRALLAFQTKVGESAHIFDEMLRFLVKIFGFLVKMLRFSVKCLDS